MSKQGRPKTLSVAKNRKHCVILNERAEILFQELRKKRPEFKISQYVSESLIDDFEYGQEQYLIKQLNRVQKEMDKLSEVSRVIAGQIAEIRDDKREINQLYQIKK